MNYLTEIKAFYDLVQIKQLSTGQIALWHGLMYINNKCDWNEWFTVANLTLQLETGLSRAGINKNRNVLKQLGLIDFKPNTTKATSYKIITMSKSNQVSSQISNQDSNQIGNQNSSTLNKLNKTKLNKTSSSIKFYMENINPLITPHEVEILEDYCNDLPEDLIIYAMQDAIEHKAMNMKYIKSILDRYIRQSISSVEQIESQKKLNQSNNKKQETDEEKAERYRKEWGLSDDD
jgi:DnaD/phage-associated family protein|nr:MAG TPA: Replication initiation and membrane attachment [Caudoviricetes sp.]